MVYDFDLFVIGGGSAGVRCARISAGFGARVALAETLHMGGTCVNVGCVPKKLLVYAAQFGEAIREARGYGWDLSGTLDWKTLLHNKNQEIGRLNGIYRRMLDGAGVKIIDGYGRMRDPHTVQVGSQTFTAAHILIATGGRPVVPHIMGREHACTSNEIFYIPERPDRILIVGGGYIGLEFASIFRGCGSQVTVVHNHDCLLNHFDPELGTHLAIELEKRGVELLMGQHVEVVERTSEGRVATTDRGARRVVDEVLFATGRRPNTSGMGLEEVGVALDERGGVVVDADFCSTVPNIYAVGDVKAGPQLTPVALEEGMALARRLFGDQPEASMRYDCLATVVFSIPQVGTVGLSEQEALERHGDIDVYKSTFTPMKHTLTGTGEKTFMKMVVERAGQRVVGVHMVGPDAGEILQGIAIAMKMGATKQQFDATIGIHPTAAEEFVTMRTPWKPE